MNNKILFIQTSEHKKIKISLFDKKVYSKTKQIVPGELSEIIIPFIIDFLQSRKLNLSDISEIVVYAGPGSYTSLRIGILTANTMAASLNIAINSITKNKTFESYIKAKKEFTKEHFTKPVDAYYQQAID